MRVENFKLFKGEVMKALVLRDWERDDLAKAIGYSRSAVYNVLNGGQCSDKLPKAIVRELGLPEYLAT